MNPLTYESGGIELDGQQVLKSGSISMQFVDTSDEDASLFEVNDSEEELDEVGPQPAPQARNFHAHQHLIKDSFPGYMEQDNEDGFLFEGIEKHSSSDDGFISEDKVAPMEHVTRVVGEGSCLDRTIFDTFSSQVQSKIHVPLSDPGKQEYDVREDIISYGHFKGRDPVIDMMETTSGCIYEMPNVQSVKEFSTSVGVAEQLYPSSKSKDSKSLILEMERTGTSINSGNSSHELLVSVSEQEEGSQEVPKGAASSAQTLAVVSNKDVDQTSFPFFHEKDRADIKSPMRSGPEATALEIENGDFAFHSQEAFVSRAVKQETSLSGATERSHWGRLGSCKGFEVGRMRITRSMSQGRHFPKGAADLRPGTVSGPHVGKRTGNRVAARGIRSVWGTTLGLQSLASDIGTPMEYSEKEGVCKDAPSHDKLNLNSVRMQQTRKRKGKIPASVKSQVLQGKCSYYDKTQENMLEDKTFVSAENSKAVQVSHENVPCKSMAGCQKELYEKMQHAGHADSVKQRVSNARKRSALVKKNNCREKQESGDVKSADTEMAINGLMPLCMDSSLQTDLQHSVHGLASTEMRLIESADMMPELSSQNPVFCTAAIPNGRRSVECVEHGHVGNQMSGANAGLQMIVEQTLQVQENMGFGSCTNSVFMNADSLASNEAIKKTINNVCIVKQVEKEWETQLPDLKVESQQLTDLGMHVKEKNDSELFVKGTRGDNEIVSPQNEQCDNDSSVQFVERLTGFCDLPQSVAGTEASRNGKGPKKSMIEDDFTKGNLRLFQTSRSKSSSWQKKAVKFPCLGNPEDREEKSLPENAFAMSIGAEQDRKFLLFREDAGSETSHDGVTKLDIDCLQHPEMKSYMKGRGNRKGKAKRSADLSGSAQVFSNAGDKQKHFFTRKPSSKTSECLQGEACWQSRCVDAKTVTRRRRRLKKGVILQACVENKKDEIQEIQVKRKRKRESKKVASGLKVVEGTTNCASDDKARDSRKKIVDASKLASTESTNPKGRQKKKVSKAPLKSTSGLLVRETKGISTLVKDKMTCSRSKKGGKKPATSLLEGNIVGEDPHHLSAKVVAGTETRSFERCGMSISNSLPLMGDQTSDGGLTTLKVNEPGESVAVGDVAVFETQRRLISDSVDIEISTIVKTTAEGGFSGSLPEVQSTHNLGTYAGIEEVSHHLLASRELNVTTIGEDVSSGVTEAECLEQVPNLSGKVEESAGIRAGSPGVGWVMCDDCRKWRCISTELADMLEATDARWTCSDNPNKEFADCSVPQEKSNAQINAELDLSDDTIYGEDEDKDVAVESKPIEFLEGSRPTTWTLIRHNIFLHRRRKTHDNDDSVICHCKPPEDGSPGCGDNCINRMVSVECVPEICPCGEACSNQQFRKRMYANVALFRSGKKGFGLRILENVSKGSFITEYVGEVLDVSTFEARQKEYARNGQKHFYFMTLNSSEVIDAYAKGNLGRFINHSCEPNCQTEKWWVNGEICIGLFAIRDLVQGEEITFDYHYEPVYGAAVKKCECGSSHCRGYIGGQPLNPNSIAESDSDEEQDPEPVMLEEESEEEAVNLEDKTVVSAKKFRGGSEAASWEPKMARAGRLKRKRSFGTKPDEPGNSPKSSFQSKRPKCSTVLRRNPGTKDLLLEPNVGRQDWGRPSKLNQISEVEGKLNALLDTQGGLVRRKDVAKQYMKLLVISIASGETVQGGPSWSVRDLSLLLDAVLKTSSRSVLSDILQKNGLQLLHNLVKQSRRNWKKIPILRKLMKVLELLSVRKVLTEKHISCIPSRPGMESFMESIFELTRHDDTEVQQIARRLKTKWFPVGAHWIFGEKQSKPQPWRSTFQQPNSHQRFLSADSSFPPPDESSRSQNIFLRSSEQPASQTTCSGSIVSAERCSSIDILQTATVTSAASTMTVKGGSNHFNNRSRDPALPENPNTNLSDQGPSRRKRVSRWDQPARKDHIFSEPQHLLDGNGRSDCGGNIGGPADVHHTIPSSGVRSDSGRQFFLEWNCYNQSGDGDKPPVEQESFLSRSDSQAIKTDSRSRTTSGPENSPGTHRHSKSPKRWFKCPMQPPKGQQSSQNSRITSGALPAPFQGNFPSAARPISHPSSVHVRGPGMAAGSPQVQPFMERTRSQGCYRPPRPVGPFPGLRAGACPPAPHGNAFSPPPCRQLGVQVPFSPSSSPVPSQLLRGPMQMPNGVSRTPHVLPPSIDSGNLHNARVRGPGQVPLARAVFRSGQRAQRATSPGFKNHEVSGCTRPHSACYPLQDPPVLTANKTPVSHLGPSSTMEATRHQRSYGGYKLAANCKEAMVEFEPEPPVPGL